MKATYALLALTLASGCQAPDAIQPAQRNPTSDYYQRFTEAYAAGREKLGSGFFVTNKDLINHANSGPILTNAPIPMAKLRESGEVAGIKLGMTMSEVVAA